MRTSLVAVAVIVIATRADARPRKGTPPPPAPPPPASDPAPPPAPAGDIFAIAAIDIAGDADPGLKSAIAASLDRGLDAGGAPRVAADVVASALHARPELVGCTSTTCLAKLGSIVGATRFLTARVEAAGAAYNVELTVLTGDGPVARKTATCEVCTMSELGDLLAKKTQELITQPLSQPIAITLATDPAGGDLAVASDGAPGSLRSVGKAPAQVALPPGTYLVEVKLAGYSVLRKTITVADSGDPQSFQLALEPTARVLVEPAPRYHRWKWIAAGGGALALVAGVIALAADGGDTCGTPPCRQLYDGKPAGFTLVGVGVIAGVASGWMFWHDSHERSATAIVAPVQGGAAAALTLSF